MKQTFLVPKQRAKYFHRYFKVGRLQKLFALQ